MSIIRVTVRTFQSVEHANMFVVMSEKVANESNNTNLKINVKVIQNVDQKIINKSEIIIMSACDDRQDEFLKNEYILNLNELVMTRNYVYKEKTYQKYRLTDLSVKKSNSYVRVE